MKLFRTKSNASTPSSGKPNRLSRILGSNRSKVDVASQQGTPTTQSSTTLNIPTNPFPSPKSSSPQDYDLPPHLPPIEVTRTNGTFIEMPPKDFSSQINSDISIMDERDMTRKLMDVESSFVPEEKREQKPETYFVSETNHWPVTRSVSPDRTERSQTYLNYGPGKVHHRTVTYNVLDKEPGSEAGQSSEVRSTADVRGREASASDQQHPRPSSQISQSRDRDARSQSRAQDQSFYTAATNIRSDIYQTPIFGTGSSLKQVSSYEDEDELDYGDSPVGAPSQQNIPSSPISAAALRRTERTAPISEAEYKHPDDSDRDETTPRQARKRTSLGSAHESRIPPDSPIRSANNSFYTSGSERPISPVLRSGDIQNRGASQLSTLSDAATNSLQRPKFHNRQMSKSSELSTASSTSSLKRRVTSEDPVTEQSNTEYAASSTNRSQRPSVNQNRHISHNSTRSTAHPTGVPQRPSGLQSRQASQFSTLSSAQSTDILDYLDQSADYALQTGGAMSAESSMMQTGGDLRRAPSFGSEASSIFYGSPQRVVSRAPRNMDGEQDDTFTERASPSSQPETPRPPPRIGADPTDTVLAQHVRDVFVPETVAREYRANHSLIESTEDKLVMATPKVGYGKSSLTLKEQNSKIDKLTKENFDLKLKIHFLYQALQDRSEEGVQDLVAKNAHLQAELVKVKKDSQSMRKRLRALEKEQQEQADTTSTIQSLQYESESESSAQASRYEDEIAHFKTRARNLEAENENIVKVWQDMLNEELTRMKQIEKEIQQVREENFQLKNMKESTSPEVQQLQQEIARLRESSNTEIQDLQQEISRLKDHRSPLRRLKLRRSRPNLRREGTNDSRQSQTSEATLDRQGEESLSGTTVVDHLKQENADLRRDLGAQTSMLTSRNRERERLQQEIEDLKLLQRHGDVAKSVTSDGLLDRSVSRNHFRSASHTSGYSQLSEPDRDRYESMQARLRDENASLRMRNQELQRDVNELDDSRMDADAYIKQMSEAIKQMELQLEEKEREIEELVTAMQSQEEESNTFRQELKDIGESLNHVMDDRENTQSIIESLQKDLVNANAEVEAMERSLRETKAVKERTEVQQESSQSEISFLREEQESDKIKIGELESSLRKAKASYRNEEAIMKDIDELGAEAQRAREEARRLRKTLSAKEAEALSSTQKLDELENTLRDALGRWDGSRTSLLKEATQIRQELEDAMTRIDQANANLNEKEDMITERETLLDASNLEIRRLTELVNGERKVHKAERAELEQRAREAGTTSGGTEVQLAELEYTRLQHRRQLEALDQRYTDQLHERNALLFSLWCRLSTLCGASWAKRHHISEDENTMPTLDGVAKDLPHFTETVSLALKHIDTIVTHFRAKLNKTEDEIWQDFQKLDEALQARFKRLEQLEKVAQRSAANPVGGNGATTDSFILSDLAHFKDENKLLRREIKHMKQFSSFALPGLASPKQSLDMVNAPSGMRPSATPSIDTSPRSKRNSAVVPSSALVQTTPSFSIEPHLSERNNSNSIVATTPGASANDVTPRPGMSLRSSSALGSTSALGMGRSPYVHAPSFGQQQQQQQQPHQRNQPLTSTSTAITQSNPQTQTQNPIHSHTHTHSLTRNPVPPSTSTDAADEARWVLRLEELQRRLEREREGRLLDRDGARTRLLEERREVEGLKKELARSKVHGGGASSSALASGSAGGVRGTRAGGVLGGGAGGRGDDGVD